MKRVAFAAIVSVMAGVLTACPPQVPPDYQPPTIESIEVTPQPVQPGGTLTVRIEARDDVAVTGGGVTNLYTPSGTRLTWTCPDEVVPVGAPGDRTHVVMTITCQVPTYASNGTWQLDTVVGDGMPPTANYPGRRIRIPFEVTGGTDDRQPPRLLSYDIAPEVVDQETTFTLTMRLFDESMPIDVGSSITTFDFTKPFARNSIFRCSGTSSTQVSSTEVEIVAQCVPWNYSVKGRSEPGLHRSFPPVRDALAHEGNIEMLVDVLPKPAG